jgi:hypothetical protein
MEYERNWAWRCSSARSARLEAEYKKRGQGHALRAPEERAVAADDDDSRRAMADDLGMTEGASGRAAPHARLVPRALRLGSPRPSAPSARRGRAAALIERSGPRPSRRRRVTRGCSFMRIDPRPPSSSAAQMETPAPEKRCPRCGGELSAHTAQGGLCAQVSARDGPEGQRAEKFVSPRGAERARAAARARGARAASSRSTRSSS